MRHGRTGRFRWAAAVAVLAVLLPSAEAQAVIPSAFGPIQALLVILPQLLLALAAAVLALFRPRTYRQLFAYLRSHKGLSLALACGLALLVWRPMGIFGGGAGEERGGSAWPAFRGGPSRRGSAPGARGPESRPLVLWRLAGEALGASSAVDSSAAVVGNRIYFGVSRQSPFGSSGSICAVDADSGRPVWTWTGRGELEPPLRPVFSSPAVWNDATGAPRYVVSGEGYHEDADCRIVCLDLEPVRRRQPPKLKWFAQTTSHVESAPCIHEGRVVIGAGDDGLWCLDLESGNVLWRLEGTAVYEVAEGDGARLLESLAGRRVEVTGVVRRSRPEGADDAGRITVEVKGVREAGGPSPPRAARTFERTIVGRAVKKDGAWRIEVERHYPDCESPPIVAGSRVIFGSGVGGNAVACVDIATGAELWKAPTPHPAFGAPSVESDRVVIGVGNGNFVRSDPNPAGAILCLSLADGRELWRVPAGDTIIGAVALHQGKAYACSRDGHVYVVGLADGRLAAKYAVGSPMVCSPAVTDTSIYVSTDAGKVLCLDRAQGAVRWSELVTPGSPVYSSPTVAAGRIFVGTRSKGVFCLAERPDAGTAARAARPWMGPGGNAGRTGAADDMGLPRFPSEVAGLRWPTPRELQGPVVDHVIACGDSVFVGIDGRLRRVNASDGRPVWLQVLKAEVLRADSERIIAAGPQGKVLYLSVATGGLSSPSPLFGAPEVNPWAIPFKQGGEHFSGPSAVAHGMMLLASRSRAPVLCCLSPGAWDELWETPLEEMPATPVTVGGHRVFVACEGKDKAKSKVRSFTLVDGLPLWTREVEGPVTSYLVASGDHVAFATAEGKVVVLHAADGRELHSLPVGPNPTAPALVHGTLVLCAENRIAAFDLFSGEWIWNYEDQDNIGKVVAPPVVCNETIWVGTEKRGLLAIGVKK